MGPVEWLFLLSLTPKQRATHLANMLGFASETTAASAQEDMREKPANMVRFQDTCFLLYLNGKCVCVCAYVKVVLYIFNWPKLT